MKKAGLIILAAVFLLGMYAPVSAADWDLYGSARIATFWTDKDVADTTSFQHTLQSNARVGAFVDNDMISGRFEYGTSGANANVRLLYATLALPFGDLLVGQQYAPMGAKCFISCQVYDTDNNMLQFVGYTGRQPMIQLSSQGFKVALVRPVDPGAETETVVTSPVTPPYNEVEEVTIAAGPEILLPQLQVSYDMDVNPDLFMNFAAAVQSYDLDGGDGDTLTSWQVAYNSTYTIADPFYVNLGGFYGQNVDSLNQAGGPNTYGDYTSSAYTLDANGDIEDTDTYGVLLVLGTQVNTVGLQAGAGYRESDNDAINIDDDMMGYYVNATIPLTADGAAMIRPEVGYYDYGDYKGDEDQFYAGLQWRVDF